MLTNKLHLGAENMIARIALASSLAQEEILDLKDLKDSGGKEYSRTVLFGEYESMYVGLICAKYKIHIKNQDLPKLIKLHIDEGIQTIRKQLEKNPNLNTFDFVKNSLYQS